MLRLGTLDFACESPGPLAVSPDLVTRALSDLAAERCSEGDMGFAIETLCAALVADASRAAQAHIDRLIDCGVGIETLYETYIPRAALRLGELWVDDRLGFAGVTLGMARLTEVFRRLGPAFRQTRVAKMAARRSGRQALFALTPGESHALGVVMAADYFQSSGWSVRVELRADAGDLERIVRDRPFDVIGLSAGSRRMLPDLLRLVVRLRAAARPSTRFALGGPLLGLDDTLGSQVGDDVALCASPRSLDALAATA